MDAATLVALRKLIDTERVLTAAVLVDTELVAALLPYAVGRDHTSLIVQVSGLARHAKGLQHGASIGLLVHQAATPDLDAMQVPRLSVQAVVNVLERDSQAFDEAAARLVSRFPAASTTTALGDFRICVLTLGRGRYVQGFARAVNVTAETFRALAR